MISDREREIFKNYPIAITLLEDVSGLKKRKVLKFIAKFNFFIKQIDSSILDKNVKIFLFKLLKEGFQSRLLHTSFTSEERNRLNGYYVAKWREYKRRII